jgi:hypothetical protein
VQEAASHADPRTTMRYDRAHTSLDRHAPYIVAAYVAGVPRSAQPVNHRPGRLAARPMTARRRQDCPPSQLANRLWGGDMVGSVAACATSEQGDLSGIAHGHG